jgi:hypothetical protein
LRNWRAKHGATAPPISVAAPIPTPPPSAPALDAPAAHPALADMLAAAGSPLAPTTQAAPAQGAPAVDVAAPSPQLTVDDLLAGVGVVNDMVAEGVAACVGVQLTDATRERMTSIDPRAERTLRFLAPPALPYVQSTLDRFPQYAAIGFGIIVGLVFLRTGLAVAKLADAPAPEALDAKAA